MAVYYELKDRRVIPNWRDFKRTIQLGELYSNGSNQKKNNFNISDVSKDWKLKKNIGTAADLINISFISGIAAIPEVEEASDYILNNHQDSSKSLLELVQKIKQNKTIGNKDIHNEILEKEIDTINEFNLYTNSEAFIKTINEYKKKCINEINNPINWIELARFYSMNGLALKAEKAVMVALHLAPNNRFILRSSARFFIHNENFDKALYYLRKSENIKQDPWLISAHIATSSLMGRYSPFIDSGKKLIESSNFSKFALSELLSSMGTLEVLNGSYRKARIYIDDAMISPNDNSLAQIEWLSKIDKRFNINPSSFNNVINPFEALALDFFEKGNWIDSFYNSVKWFLDMPYSKRPILLGSYIAVSLLNDPSSAINLCKVGLRANPKDANILNNLIYSKVIANDFNDLDIYLNKISDIPENELSNESKVTLNATLGLVAFRKGDIELGKKYYLKSINDAINMKNEYLGTLALLNLTRELIISKDFDKENYIEKLRQLKVDRFKDLIKLKNEVLSLVKYDT